jgi:hypothetical protein
MVRHGKQVVEDTGESSSGTTAAQATQEGGESAAQRKVLEAERTKLQEQLELQELAEEVRLLRERTARPIASRSEGNEGEGSESDTTSVVSLKRPHDDRGERPQGGPEPVRRRVVSSRSRLRIQEPEKYNSQNLRQYREFIRHCEVAHQLQSDEYPTDRTKILHASLSLEGETLDAWLRYEKESGNEVTWEDFKQMLRDLLQDPVTRALSQGLRYDRALQRQGQTVQQFVNYLDELEAELEPYSDGHRKQHLLAKLRPELRRALGNYQELPVTRTQVINLAIQLEANMEKGTKSTTLADRTQTGQGQKQQSGSQPSKSQGQAPKGKPSDKKRTDTPQADKPRQGASNRSQAGGAAQTPRTTNLKFITCYRCNKKGHYASDCPDNPGDKPKEKDPKNAKPQ